MTPRDARAGAVIDGHDGCLVDERFDRSMRLLRADQIMRDLGRLERAWFRYERQRSPPMRGQLDLF